MIMTYALKVCVAIGIRIKCETDCVTMIHPDYGLGHRLLLFHGNAGVVAATLFRSLQSLGF